MKEALVWDKAPMSVLQPKPAALSRIRELRRPKTTFSGLESAKRTSSTKSARKMVYRGGCA
jgi:hypothetical protein